MARREIAAHRVEWPLVVRELIVALSSLSSLSRVRCCVDVRERRTWEEWKLDRATSARTGISRRVTIRSGLISTVTARITPDNETRLSRGIINARV